MTEQTKRHKREMPQLPLDIVVKVTFFIPEWKTLELFMTALRPAHALGPLEHFWHLRQLNWKSRNLWPHLHLTGLNEPSRLHVEGIAKHYSVIQLSKTVDPLWLRQHTHSLTCIQWRPSYINETSDFEWFTQWKLFRLTVISGTAWHTPNCRVSLLIENLPHYKYLVDLSWGGCDFGLASTTQTMQKRLQFIEYILDV